MGNLGAGRAGWREKAQHPQHNLEAGKAPHAGRRRKETFILLLHNSRALSSGLCRYMLAHIKVGLNTCLCSLISSKQLITLFHSFQLLSIILSLLPGGMASARTGEGRIERSRITYAHTSCILSPSVPGRQGTGTGARAFHGMLGGAQCCLS